MLVTMCVNAKHLILRGHMEKKTKKAESQKNVRKATFWTDKKIWQEFQKKARSEWTSASHKLIELIERYVESVEDAENSGPPVMAQELLCELQELRRIRLANTYSVEEVDVTGDRLVLLRRPPVKALPTHRSKLAQQYIPQTQPSEKTPNSVQINFLVSPVLWNTFLDKAKAEGSNASRHLIKFIEEYLGYYNVTAEETLKIAKDIAFELKKLREILEANTGTVELNNQRVGIIRDPFTKKSHMKQPRPRRVPPAVFQLQKEIGLASNQPEIHDKPDTEAGQGAHE